MDNNYNFDPETGEPIVKETVPEQPVSEQPVYTAPEQPVQEAAPQYDAAPQYNAAPQYDAAPQPQYQAPVQSAPANSRGKAIAGMILAIASCAFCWMGLSYGFYGVLPIVAAILGKKFSVGVAPFEKVGKNPAVRFGLIASIIFTVIGFVVLILRFA